MPKRVLSSFILLLCLTALASAQSQTVWQTFISANGGEFSVTLPGSYQIYNNKRSEDVTVFGSAEGAYFEASFRKTRGGDDSLEYLHKTASEKASFEEYKVGESLVYTYKLQDEKAVKSTVYVATKKGYYSVSTSSISPTNPTVALIVSSMRLGGQPFLKGKDSADQIAGASIKVSSLQSSGVVIAAIKRRQTEKIEIQTGYDEPPPKREKMFSRGVLVVNKPYARYNEQGRANNISGTVKLRVLLKANGNIGRITVLRGLPFGLTDEAVRAASEIKFLPAEILGQPVDDELTVEYSFAIY